MQSLFDQLISDMRPVEVAGIDVVDTEFDHLAQDRKRAVVVCRRPEYMRTRQLHGTVPHASQGEVLGERECASGQWGGRHTLLPVIHRVCSAFEIQSRQRRLPELITRVRERAETNNAFRSAKMAGPTLELFGWNYLGEPI